MAAYLQSYAVEGLCQTLCEWQYFREKDFTES